jgi:hypothetical protein
MWRMVWFAPAFIAGATGLGLGFYAWYSASAPMGVWATVLLLLAPALGVFGTPRERSRADTSATPEDLFEHLDRALLTLKFIQATRAVSFIGNSFTLILWLSESGGMISARQFVIPYTIACLASLALYLPWLASREREILEVIAVDRQVLKARRAAATLGDGNLGR